MKKPEKNKGGKPRLKPGETTVRFTINVPESLAKRIHKAADKDNISYGEWFRRMAALALNVDL